MLHLTFFAGCVMIALKWECAKTSRIRTNHVEKRRFAINSQLRILIGDDGTSFARSLAARLRRRDCVCSVHRQSVANMVRSVQQEQPHIILLDITDKTVDYYALMNALRKHSDAPVFAVTVARNAYLEKLLWQAGLRNIWLKPLDEEAALREMRICLHGEAGHSYCCSMTVEALAAEFLRAIGIPANMAGYRYLLAVLEMTVEEPSLVQGICKNVYPVIAARFGVNVPCVERNIRGVLNHVRTYTNSYVLEQMLGYPSSSVREKLSNARFIAGATEHLRMDPRMQELMRERAAYASGEAVL